MKRKFIQIISAYLFLLTSCERLVEIDPPRDQMISSVIFESDEAAISATTGIYATIMKNDFPISYNMALFTGLYSDELEYHQSVMSLVSLYNYALIPSDAPTNSMWTNGFNYIYQANAVIEGLNKAANISSPIKKQLMGEALFIRSFWYYYMSNLYGSLPLILTTDYNLTSSLRKSEKGIIQNQIIKDLNSAKELLSEKYVSGNSINESTERIRPNTYVVSALLARIYLESKDFEKAEQEATRIIANNKYDLSDISAVFKRTSKEVIWQLEFPTNSIQSNSYEANMFTLVAKPNSSLTQRCTIISSGLLALFSEKDKRLATWIGTYTDNTVSPAVKYNYPSKYKSRSIPADEYTTPFRLAEMYLIRAEARAQLGQLSDAINDTDKVRIRAGIDALKDLAPDLSANGLLDSIASERRRELFCEWGLRWLDIRRSSFANDLMKAIASQKGTIWKNTAVLWPIPLNDVINSGNLIEQNDGYN